jgi:hypothetical protein
VGDEVLFVQEIETHGADRLGMKVIRAEQGRIWLGARQHPGFPLERIKVGVTPWNSWWMRTEAQLDKRIGAKRVEQLVELANMFCREEYAPLVADRTARTPIAEVYWRGVIKHINGELEKFSAWNSEQIFKEKYSLRAGVALCKKMVDRVAQDEDYLLPALKHIDERLYSAEQSGGLIVKNRMNGEVVVEVGLVGSESQKIRLVAGASHFFSLLGTPGYYRCQWRELAKHQGGSKDFRVTSGQFIEFIIQ